MSRPIILSEATIKRFLAMIKTDLAKCKVFDSKLNINYSLPHYEDARAKLVFEPTAFAKMLSLVNEFETEVAWHGTVERDDNTYTITDVLVYPQEVAGATVNTDQEEYERWLYELDDEQFNTLRMQGHSHVNMGTSPSTVDLSHQERIVEQLEDDMFYIFIIWNKKMSYTLKIFDLKENILYENNDIDIYIGDVPFDNESFIDDAKALVKKKSYGTTTVVSSKKGNSYYSLGSSFLDDYFPK